MKPDLSLACRRFLPAAALAILLGACGAPAASVPATSPPAEQPTVSQPSAEPSATAPTAAPTAATQPTAAQPTVQVAADVLPAALYFTANQSGQVNQIWRLDRDGKTRAKLLEEPPAQGMLTIVEFEVSPADGALAYLVQGENGNTLVRTDAEGKQRKVLIAGGSISQIRWSPDGKTIAYAQFQAPDATQGPAGGVYLIPSEGGEPKLLQANDTVKDPSNPAPEARGYSPQAWSPDGEALLLNAFSQSVELCDLAVKYVASGDPIVLSAPEGLHAKCGSGVWDPQSQTIYLGMDRPGYLAPLPGLWRATPTNGRSVPEIAGEPTKGSFTLAEAPLPLSDGSLNVFLATTNTLPEPGDDPSQPPTQFTMTHVAVDGQHTQKLSDATFADVENRVLWARDGSGALLDQGVNPATGSAKLIWAPANGAPAVEIADDLNVNGVRWGP